MSAKDNIHFPHDVDLEEFKKDYLDKSITARDMQEKYRISPRQYRLVVRQVYDKYNPKKKSRMVDKHIYQNGFGKFVIRKRKSGEFGYYGAYDTLKEARTIRDRLISYNWDKRVI